MKGTVFNGKLPCPCCDGTGLAIGVLVPPLTTFCGCRVGRLVRDAAGLGAWPMSETRAKQISKAVAAKLLGVGGTP